MGSSGSDSFSDYRNSGQSDNVNLCLKAFTTHLDEVARCEYFSEGKSVPAESVEVEVSDSLIHGRLGVKVGDLVIGLLPTKFHYLLKCMREGNSYRGYILTSRLSPVPFIQVDISPR